MTLGWKLIVSALPAFIVAHSLLGGYMATDRSWLKRAAAAGYVVMVALLVVGALVEIWL